MARLFLEQGLIFDCRDTEQGFFTAEVAEFAEKDPVYYLHLSSALAAYSAVNTRLFTAGSTAPAPLFLPEDAGVRLS